MRVRYRSAEAVQLDAAAAAAARVVSPMYHRMMMCRVATGKHSIDQVLGVGVVVELGRRSSDGDRRMSVSRKRGLVGQRG